MRKSQTNFSFYSNFSLELWNGTSRNPKNGIDFNFQHLKKDSTKIYQILYISCFFGNIVLKCITNFNIWNGTMNFEELLWLLSVSVFLINYIFLFEKSCIASCNFQLMNVFTYMIYYLLNLLQQFMRKQLYQHWPPQVSNTKTHY